MLKRLKLPTRRILLALVSHALRDLWENCGIGGRIRLWTASSQCVLQPKILLYFGYARGDNLQSNLRNDVNPSG